MKPFSKKINLQSTIQTRFCLPTRVNNALKKKNNLNKNKKRGQKVFCHCLEDRCHVMKLSASHEQIFTVRETLIKATLMMTKVLNSNIFFKD